MCFFDKGNSETARPLVVKQTDRLRRNLAGTNPGADHCQKNGHQKYGTEDVDGDLCAITVCLFHNPAGQPFGGQVGQQNQNNNTDPDKQHDLHSVGPDPQMKAAFKTGDHGAMIWTDRMKKWR